MLQCAMASLNKSIVDRFNEKWIPEPNSGCWIWIAARMNRQGYGATYLNKKTMLAHRASFILFKGPIPDGLIVRHSCDTPACVNPSHLSLGTYKDNRNDAVIRGRAKHHVRSGSHNFNTKLSEIEVAAIKIMATRSSQTEVAALFKITQSHVSNIVHNKTRVLRASRESVIIDAKGG